MTRGYFMATRIDLFNQTKIDLPIMINKAKVVEQVAKDTQEKDAVELTLQDRDKLMFEHELIIPDIGIKYEWKYFKLN